MISEAFSNINSVIGLLTSVLLSFSYGKYEECLWAYVAVHKNLSSLTLGKVSEAHVGSGSGNYDHV